MVSIAPNAAVEVLDWGGRGRALVLLAGLGDTPHVYDDLAPALTDSFHVLGITRRGFGHSTGLPDTTVAALVEDLRAVLDSLRLSRVILVGHSIAGEELTAFGATYAERCEALVYLDAAGDRSGRDTALAGELDRLWRPALGRPRMTPADSASLPAVESYYARNVVRGLPEAETRALTRFDSTGRYAGEIGYDSLGAPRIGRLLDGLKSPAYDRLGCPSLAISAVSDSAAAYFPWYHTLDSAGKRDATRYFHALAPGLRADLEQYRREAPFSHVVEIHDASHWVFLSNRDEVLHALRLFLATAGS